MATNFGGDLAKIWHMPPSFIVMALHDWSIAKLMGAFTLAMTPLHWIEFDERRMNLASLIFAPFLRSLHCEIVKSTDSGNSIHPSLLAVYAIYHARVPLLTL